jgi:hypothetical protein
MDRGKWKKNHVAFHAKRAATMHRRISSRHNPLISQPDIPANPPQARSAATTARISIVTVHDNILECIEGLKRARPSPMR